MPFVFAYSGGFGFGYMAGREKNTEEQNLIEAQQADLDEEWRRIAVMLPNNPRSVFVVRDDMWVSTRDEESNATTHYRIPAGSEFFIPVTVHESMGQQWTTLLHECGFVRPNGKELSFKAGDLIQFPDYAAAGEMKTTEDPRAAIPRPPVVPELTTKA